MRCVPTPRQRGRLWLQSQHYSEEAGKRDFGGSPLHSGGLADREWSQGLLLWWAALAKFIHNEAAAARANTTPPSPKSHDCAGVGYSAQR